MQKKKPRSEDYDLDTKVGEYMKKQNRPYSLINVFDNLRGAHPKPALQLSLERLSADGGFLVGKSYGAQKFFYCKQEIFGDCSSDAVRELETQVAELRASLSRVNAETAGLLADCPASDAALKTQRDAALAGLASVNEELEALKSRTAQASGLAEEFERHVEMFGGHMEESERRKRTCMRMLDSMGESLNMTRVDLAHELGVDLTL